MTTQDLQTAKFVAGVGNSRRAVGTEDIHLFELSYDSSAKIGDRGTNSWQHGIEIGQLLPMIE